MIYAGNHGLEIEGPGLEAFHHEDLVHYRRRSETLARDLKAVEVEGAWTEAKGPTLTFHYREAPEDKREALVEEARGNTAQAIEHLQAALQAWANADAVFKPAAEARAKLAELEGS